MQQLPRKTLFIEGGRTVASLLPVEEIFTLATQSPTEMPTVFIRQSISNMFITTAIAPAPPLFGHPQVGSILLSQDSAYKREE
jgi:hypothetical protein